MIRVDLLYLRQGHCCYVDLYVRCIASPLASPLTSYWALGQMPLPPELGHVHQSVNFYLRTTPVGSGKLLVRGGAPIGAGGS